MEQIIKKCRNCRTKLHFKRVGKEMGKFLRSISPSLNSKNTPDYCRKCYNPDFGIDKRKIDRREK